MSFFAGRRQSEESEREERQQQSRTPISAQPIGFETVLGMGSLIEGKVSSKGNVRLDGEFKGTLDISGNILVGETANIHADIDARNISIAGAVHGNVTGHKVQLLRTGRIWGDIHAGTLTIEEGAFVEGRITMKTDIAAPVERQPDSLAAIVEPNAPSDNPEEPEIISETAAKADPENTLSDADPQE
jgi:cytoskeletal protein CcmA (bactofilin family)